MVPEIMHISIPVIGVLLFSEMWYSWKEDLHLYEGADTRHTLFIGIGAVLFGLLTKAIFYKILQWIYAMRITTLPENVWTWILVFLAADFSFYWYHRASHRISILWANHSVHHSSEQYNISVALRLPWMNLLTGHFLFWCWLPWLGFNPIMVILSYQCILFYQTWLHTKTIDRLPYLISFVFNTPSHHRVHHASNTQYLDKNHGGILIIWDRLLGTFQEEDEKPVFGLTRKINNRSFGELIFGEFIVIYNKCKTSRSIKQRLRFLFYPPEWNGNTNRPA